MTDKEILQFIYERLINVHGENANYDYMLRLKLLLERSDNSDYATASPKLPSLQDVKEEIAKDNYDKNFIERTYFAIKKLGNFA